MRVHSIAVICGLALLPPINAALAQSAATDSHEVSEPPVAPASRARVEGAPTLFERLLGGQQQQQPAAQPAAQAAPAPTTRGRSSRAERRAERAQRRADRAQRRAERRAERRAVATTQRLRTPRREARRAAPQEARRATPQSVQASMPLPRPNVAEAPQAIPLPLPHPHRATEEAVATVDATTLAYEAANDDPRERCHVVLASEAEHDFAEVLRCRQLLER